MILFSNFKNYYVIETYCTPNVPPPFHCMSSGELFDIVSTFEGQADVKLERTPLWTKIVKKECTY